MGGHSDPDAPPPSLGPTLRLEINPACDRNLRVQQRIDHGLAKGRLGGSVPSKGRHVQGDRRIGRLLRRSPSIGVRRVLRLFKLDVVALTLFVVTRMVDDESVGTICVPALAPVAVRFDDSEDEFRRRGSSSDGERIRKHLSLRVECLAGEYLASLLLGPLTNEGTKDRTLETGQLIRQPRIANLCGISDVDPPLIAVVD